MIINNKQLLISEITTFAPWLAGQVFKRASSGTRHEVYLSDQYVIRISHNDTELIRRESELLHALHHPLVPTVLWNGAVAGGCAMIERRLPGLTLDTTWRSMTADSKQRVVNEVVDFLIYLRTQTGGIFYSVSTGRRHKSAQYHLTAGLAKKLHYIERLTAARSLVADIATILRRSIGTKIRPTLAHGDLIIHNLLTDGQKLTGVLDWEFARYTVRDYDLFRLRYYQECAAAYVVTGNDETYESDYMRQLIAAIYGAGLIKNEDEFENQYTFLRALFFLDALVWAAKSQRPEEEAAGLVVMWNKKSGPND